MKKYLLSLLTVLLFICVVSSDNIYDNSNTYIKFELENADLVNLKKVKCNECSGSNLVTDFQRHNGKSILKLNINNPDFYNVKLNYRIPNNSDKKKVQLKVNNSKGIELTLANNGDNTFKDSVSKLIYLNKGLNTIIISSSWGYLDLDYITISNVTKLNYNLVNKNSNSETRRLMSFLLDNYGKKIIAGQQNIDYVDWIYEKTGKKPAIIGFDFMDYSPSRVENGNYSNEVDKAIEWSKNGGIVTFSWHWNAPKDLSNWKRGFYTDGTHFNLDYALRHTDSEDYKLLLRDIDQIAIQLKKLENNNVPVIFRPLHEAEGGWFWWGAKGPEAAKKLYITLYKRITNYHQLNNIIWVWNSISPDWYPGDNYVDIVSYNSFPSNYNYSSVIEKFDLLNDLVNNKKLVSISENGSIPDPIYLNNDQANWSWFLTWDSFIKSKNTIDHIKYIYNNDYVLTLDEIPKDKN